MKLTIYNQIKGAAERSSKSDHWHFSMAFDCLFSLGFCAPARYFSAIEIRQGFAVIDIGAGFSNL